MTFKAIKVVRLVVEFEGILFDGLITAVAVSVAM